MSLKVGFEALCQLPHAVEGDALAALFQIILGAAVTFIPNLPLHFEFESEMFMMLVIAPLLFTDGFNSFLKNI